MAMDEEAKAVARRVAACRRFLGLSQKGLAERLGMTRARIANIESGRALLKFGQGWALCRALDVSAWWLFMGDGNMVGFDGAVEDRYAERIIRASGRLPFCDVLGEWGAVLLAPEHAAVDPNASLTRITQKRDTPAVRSEIETLVTRANRIAAKVGKKAELARFLCVPRQRVSEWLSGKTCPGGETTLRLLKWVEEEERNQQ